MNAHSDPYEPLGNRSATLDISFNRHYRNYVKEGKSVMHSLCDIPTLTKSRQQALNTPFFDNFKDNSN